LQAMGWLSPIYCEGSSIMINQSVSRFWGNYIAKTKSYKIKSSVAR
jgi:hypothetical protein